MYTNVLKMDWMRREVRVRDEKRGRESTESSFEGVF
jgi:hypothetical protein